MCTQSDAELGAQSTQTGLWHSLQMEVLEAHGRAPNNATECFGALGQEGGHDPVRRGCCCPMTGHRRTSTSPACCSVKPSRLPRCIAREQWDCFGVKVTLSGKGHSVSVTLPRSSKIMLLLKDPFFHSPGEQRSLCKRLDFPAPSHDHPAGKPECWCSAPCICEPQNPASVSPRLLHLQAPESCTWNPPASFWRCASKKEPSKFP